MPSLAHAVALLLGVASQIQAAQPPQFSPQNETPKEIAKAKLEAIRQSGSANHRPDGTADDTPSDTRHKHNAPKTTLFPNVHWSYDTKLMTNVLPVEPQKGSELYYGVSDPSKSGHFAFLTYYFTLPSVNIDHTDHVNIQYLGQDTITASFANKEAFDHAVNSWSAGDGLLLIAHVPGCEGYARGQRCYFSVTDVEFKPQELSLIAKGSSKHPDEVTTSGETEWGWWEAREGDTAAAAAAAAPAPDTPSSGGVLASRSPSSSKDATGIFDPISERPMGHLDCVAAPDAQHGLPTACSGTSFDQILDDKLGHGKMSLESTRYLKELTSSTFRGFNLAGSTLSSSSITPAKRRRITRSLLAQRNVWSGVGKFYKRALDTVYDAVTQVQSIGGSVSREFSFKLPDPASPDSPAWTLLNGTVREESPWGEAILLNALFETAHDVSTGPNSESSLKVYCVDCGVSGHAKVAGRAKWSPEHGLQEGRVELTADLQFALKIGLEGSASIEQHFSIDLLSYGLPSLSYGVVDIGPYVTLGARVDVAAASEGNLLAGAEMGLQDARVVMDLVNLSPVNNSGWGSPYFKPIFETSNHVDVSAELGLPIGLKCGLKISTWEEAVGIVDEPSIKGMASGDASATLKPNITGSGLLASEFKDDCAGIMTQISWRNRLWAGAVKADDDPVVDTDDHVFFSKCIDNSTIAAAAARIHVPKSRRPRQLTVRRSNNNNKEPSSQRLSKSMITVSKSLYSGTATNTKLVQLVNPRESTKMVSCANGNVYAVRNDDSTNEYCFGQWEETKTKQHSVVVHDAMQRTMYYYKDTMSALGVSRLRASNADEVPRTAVAIALIPLRDPEGQQQLELHVALDPSHEVFYPVVCDFVDKNSASKIFLVRDPVEGPATLQRKDIVSSVTGGPVAECKVLGLKTKA
ncbi:hypothetical protein E4U55_007970 [Claviceps digitariae]|nr:hypothetical protein E4U55_007970 [Claviceps digitariae]